MYFPARGYLFFPNDRDFWSTGMSKKTVGEGLCSIAVIESEKAREETSLLLLRFLSRCGKGKCNTLC